MSEEQQQAGFDLDQIAAEMAEEQDVEKKPRRVGLIIAGVIGLVVLLGGAAFVAFRMMGQSTNVMIGGGPGKASFTLSGPGGQTRSFAIEMTPAAELPTTPSELAGTYFKQEGNSVFVHQIVEGAFNPANRDAGPEVEIVLTADTVIYKDATGLPEPDELEGTVSMQQVVEQVSGLDGISDQAFLRVWGERRGDRVIATVILYSEPVIRMAPASGQSN